MYVNAVLFLLLLASHKEQEHYRLCIELYNEIDVNIYLHVVKRDCCTKSHTMACTELLGRRLSLTCVSCYHL